MSEEMMKHTLFVKDISRYDTPLYTALACLARSLGNLDEAGSRTQERQTRAEFTERILRLRDDISIKREEMLIRLLKAAEESRKWDNLEEKGEEWKAFLFRYEPLCPYMEEDGSDAISRLLLHPVRTGISPRASNDLVECNLQQERYALFLVLHTYKFGNKEDAKRIFNRD